VVKSTRENVPLPPQRISHREGMISISCLAALQTLCP
jgi:hypothetical protein